MSILLSLLAGYAAVCGAATLAEGSSSKGSSSDKKDDTPRTSGSSSSSGVKFSSSDDEKRWREAPYSKKKEYLSNNEYFNKYLSGTTEAKRNCRNEAWEYYKQITPNPTSAGFEVWLDGRS